MRLTVLGKSPAWQDAGGACSGYLIERDSTAILLDCGNGVFGKLRERIDHRRIEAVAISHLHGDHVLDLVPFAYALTLGPPSGSGERRRPRLLAPAGAGAFFRRIVGAWGPQELLEKAFALEEYEPGARLEVGPIGLAMHPVPHFTATHAVELSSPDGGRIVFGADGRASEELAEAARGAQVLLAEATLPEPDPAPLSERGHMSAGEAGAVARRAGVERLALVHISDMLDLERAREQAAAAFGGPVEVAREGSVYEVA